jgi:sensor histidine kinase YesM
LIEGAIVRPTLLALLEPRRLLPIAIVCAALVSSQWVYSRHASAVPLALLLCLTFVLVAPVSFRVLFPEEVSLLQGAVRLALYAALGVGAVLSVGFVLPRLLGLPRTFLTTRNSLAISAALFLVGGWGLGRDVGMEASLRRERRRSKELEQKAELQQLLALRAHLDPHFLFNTLSAIAEWCRQDGEVAEKAVLQLSSMLRAMLDGVRAPSWPLRRELELCTALFALHLLRDPGFFELALPPLDALPAAEVPPMILLPLAENAVTHGPAAGHRGRIVLEVRVESGNLRLVIENPGAYRGPRPGRTGLALVERRLALAYGGRASLALRDAGGRTRAELLLPFSPPGASA